MHQAGVNALGSATATSLVVIHTDTTVQCDVQGSTFQRPVIFHSYMALSTAMITAYKKRRVQQDFGEEGPDAQWFQGTANMYDIPIYK